ncbi:MAG: hypothetical protein R2755_10725 [Acidimicrobiales bacterium]
MAANLVRHFHPEDDALHRLLNRSFAQYQADRTVVWLERRLAERRADLERLQAGAGSETPTKGWPSTSTCAAPPGRPPPPTSAPSGRWNRR